MNKISLNKKYRTIGGDKVEIIKIDMAATYTVLAVVTCADGAQGPVTYTEDGFVHSSKHFCKDNLVEISPYEDFKIDEPVMVRNSDNSFWLRRHFAGVSENGKAKAWVDGRTSFSWSCHEASWTVTAESHDVSAWSVWLQCRRPTPEELNWE